jgi:hypothetical protein
MQTTLVYARKMTLLDYPEDTQAELEERMLRLVRKDDLESARQVLDKVRPDVERQLARIADELKGLKGIDTYVAHWQRQLAGVEYWQKLARQRRSEKKP